MKKYLILLFSAILAVVSSCTKNTGGDQDVPPQVVTNGVYILNNGNYASNDASLSLYNPVTKALSTNVFQNKNGRKLGDLAQSMLIYGGKMYIAVYNSKVLFVTDSEGKIVEELKISNNGQVLSPRGVVGHNGKVYVTLYEGYLAQVDTTSYSTRLVKVGDNPEGVAVSGEKVFVANSGGMNYPVYGKTVSVVDISSMTEIKTIEVADNPTALAVNIRGEVFLISMGNYVDVFNTLQRIDPNSYSVTVLSNKPVTYMSMGSDSRLYFLSAQYDEDNVPDVSVGIYNTLSGAMEADFMMDGTKIKESPTCFSVDPVTEDVYIGTSDYVSEGDMYVFSKDGKLKDQFTSGGLNPMGVYFRMGLSK